ncbi:sugar transferase [Marivita hallyeonensis]|uniref:Sugar transferase involved in LPS biosynthesis (Colanic, teichoic acid) n=1 Tax=Marivita hallyeonensis TaxID=996342 RepID=A0A1M5U827_9RHOB|nr:sugar transferase [Marivita hallyeonensis]SHH59137.1 Sugar transferase involved in LPS biosynthesis (colanic, teichoic acid) [Marivita hallyeonensis]
MDAQTPTEVQKRRAPTGFETGKRVFDIVVAVLLMPALLLSAAVLTILNPFFNPGQLFYRQDRMGRHCEPFTALKFRSMSQHGDGLRGASDPVEHHRITGLGQFIRCSRIDEVPQIINVLKGEMSLIGPRPDYLPHARQFIMTVPGYHARHSVRPGISGLAQTEVGYVQGPLETRQKVSADLYYIRNTCFILEAWLVWRTLCTMFGLKGL